MNAVCFGMSVPDQNTSLGPVASSKLGVEPILQLLLNALSPLYGTVVSYD